MSSLFKKFETNPDKETQGTIIEFEPNEDGTVPSFRIARAGGANKRYAIEVEREARPYRRQLELGTMKSEVSEALMRKVFVHTILLDWSNVQGKDDKPIEYNEENAIALMTKLPDLYDALLKASQDASLFKDDELEQVTKN